MKKVISLLLVLTMVLSFAVVASAAENDVAAKLDKDVVVPKTYVINNGTAPAETFTFAFEGISYKNGDGELVENAEIPVIAPAVISFDALTATASKTAAFEIDPENYQLGVYTYKVTEVKPTTETTGVTYSDEELYLVLTILRDEQSNKHYVAAMHYESATGTDKSTGFTNEYDAGDVIITKEITGNMADMDKEFTFTVVFTIPEGTEAKSATVVNVAGTSETITLGKGTKTITFTLGDGETATITNIPAGVTYTVTEDKENYTQIIVNKGDGVITGGDKDLYAFTNELKSEVDTGISMDSMPYILMLVVAAVGAVAIVGKKRYEV